LQVEHHCRSYNSQKEEVFRTADINSNRFWRGILMAAAVFKIIIEAETEVGITITLLSFMGGAMIFTIAEKTAFWVRSNTHAFSLP
jgi:hypothetical protein